MQNWDDLRVFLALARTGGLGAAATALRVNKSTVQRRIISLEEQLGAKLVETRGRGYRLTDVGARVAAEAAKLDEQIDSLVRRVGGDDVGLSGTVVLATVDVLVREVLAPHLASFSEKYPNIALHVITANRNHDLQRGEAHVALRLGARPSDADLVVRRICGNGAGLYASPGYLSRHGTPRDVMALAGHRLIGMNDDLAHLPAAQYIERLSDMASVAHRYSELGAQIAAVEAGLGIAVLPYFAAEPRPGLVRLFAAELDGESSLWLAWHGDLRRNARVRALSNHLLLALTGECRRFEGR